MIQLFVYFLLISVSNQLLCVLEISKTIKFSTLSPNKTGFEEMIKNKEAVNREYRACKVVLTMNYFEQHFQVEFSHVSPEDETNGIESPKLTTIITLDSDKPSITSELSYICMKEDNCDRDFVLNRYLSLINQNYTDLHIQLAELLVKENNYPIKCFTNSSQTKANSCPQKSACRGHFKINQLERWTISEYIAECAGMTRNSTTVQITTLSSTKYSSLTHFIYYTCKSNLCNNQIISNNIADLLKTWFDVLYIFYESISTTTTSTAIRTTKYA